MQKLDSNPLAPQPALRIHEPAIRLGIAAIETLKPTLQLSNDWFGDRFPRKFEKHTGIQQRGVFHDDEVTVSQRIVQSLLERTESHWSDCAGLVLACPALVPAATAHRYWNHDIVKNEQPNRLAQRLWNILNEANESNQIHPASSPRRVETGTQESTRPYIGINGFCSGYAQAMQIVLEQLRERKPLAAGQYYLVVTATCISRINDFSNPQSGGLFGDFATATMLRRMDCDRLSSKFELCDASYQRKEANRAFFDFEKIDTGLAPTPEGNSESIRERVVFKLDGMGIADTAPRAMADAAEDICQKNHMEPANVDWVVPHQAGTGIVRLTGMKLEQCGFSVEPINGLTANCGNVSSGSVPMALADHWDRLHGHIVCPVAAVGAPGKAEVSQGCILLRGTQLSKSLPIPSTRAAG
ncbi:MAG: 3-oxoacyl-[acyl-carrier-protein] synthase III C-terminal domain-containing protein [Planctomycetota bacterium]